jgi:hypothetical protein
MGVLMLFKNDPSFISKDTVDCTVYACVQLGTVQLCTLKYTRLTRHTGSPTLYYYRY